MYKIINNSVNGIHDVKEFVADAVADIANLPSCAEGSIVIVNDGDVKVFMKNSKNEWIKL